MGLDERATFEAYTVFVFDLLISKKQTTATHKQHVNAAKGCLVCHDSQHHRSSGMRLGTVVPVRLYVLVNGNITCFGKLCSMRHFCAVYVCACVPLFVAPLLQDCIHFGTFRNFTCF